MSALIGQACDTVMVNYFSCHLWSLAGFPVSSAGEESACNAGNLGLITGWEDPLEEVIVTPSNILA